MSQTAEPLVAEDTLRGSVKDKSCLLGVIERALIACNVDRSEPVLVIGGGHEDLAILRACGFSKITLTNIESSTLPLDAEAIALPDESYPTVFAHAVLHHCRSPHKAVGEMARVAQKHVFFFEPNDSAALRYLTRQGFSFPYELAAVEVQEYERGGLRDGPIPNYIYRWTGREVAKCVASYLPERQFAVRPHPYWDFYVNEFELLSRKESRVSTLARAVGPGNLIALLHLGQAILNLFPPLRAQGNKFFCAISKKDLQPWIEVRGGQFYLRRKAR